jgi:V/A-type H+-transporting ATPase subunit I
MVVAQMQRLYLIAHRSERELILQELQRLGIVQITNLTQRLSKSRELSEMLKNETTTDLSEYDSMLTELKYAIDFLKDYEQKPSFIKELIKSLIESLFGVKLLVEEKEYKEVISNLPKYLELCKTCRKLESRLNRLRSERNKLTTLLEHLVRWKKLTLPLELLDDTEKTRTMLGTIQAKHYDGFCKELARIPEVQLQSIDSYYNECYLMLTFLKAREKEVENILKRYEFRRTIFPDLKGTPKQIIRNLEKELRELNKTSVQLENESSRLVKIRYKLLIAYDYIALEKARKSIVENFARTEQTFVIEGWIRENDIKVLESKLYALSNNVKVLTRAPEKDENPPVDLSNRKLLKPFQVVTNIYGNPAYVEIDPTPLLAPFFLLFFALCLTDAGYGIVLTALSLLALKKVRGGKSFFKLMAGCGFVTIILGALTGGWFGNLPYFIIGVEPPKMIDPIKDPISLLVLALFLGVIQAVYFGPIVKMYRNIKARQFKDAILDQFLWLLFLTGVILVILTNFNLFGIVLRRLPASITGLSPGDITALGIALKPYALILALSGAFLLVLTQGRKQKTLAKKLVVGLASLYGTTGYLGDVLSYSRLLALGLCTGIIAIVGNTLAFMVVEAPYVGIIFAIIILLIMHAFNLVISTIGAFIHTARLQFVEFFQKFFEGGGQPFKPFKLDRKYTEIKT